jgi:hypothetical protein
MLQARPKSVKVAGSGITINSMTAAMVDGWEILSIVVF